VLSVIPGTGAIFGTVSFSGMTSNVTGIHVHDAATGGIVVPLTGGTGGTSGTAAIPAGTVLTADQLTVLISGGLYFNVHTVNNAAGEIRGNIVFPTASITTALSGAEEVPPLSTPATGTANLSVNFGTGAISGTVSFSGLTSAATAAHIHQGAAGVNGGVIVALEGGAGATSGTWTVPAGSVLSGADLNSLVNDELYINLHSSGNPGGEIRGQITYRIALTFGLSGTEEVPPVATTGSGTANLLVNPASGALSGTISFTGLSSPATAAHIHQGAAGTNGGVVLALTGDAGATSGNWSVPLGTTLTVDQLNLLMSGELYINIHTTANAGGEIRGQVVVP
jgi:hypothetical protein